MTYKLYTALGLNRSNNPSSNDIKKAYKKMAMENHPDKNKGNPNAEEKFKEISNAYEILSDEKKKHVYDQVGDEGYKDRQDRGQPDMDHADIFERFFRGHGGGHPFGRGGHSFGRNPFNFDDEERKCSTVMKGMNISLDDAYEGVSKNICINVIKFCHDCTKMCANCNGDGVVKQVKSLGVFTQVFTGNCDKCDGVGTTPSANQSCKNCGGKCKYTKEINANLNIPKGINNGYKTSFSGMGEQPKTPKMQPGDLVIEFRISEHSHFTRKGNDLYYKCNLTFIESMIGKDIVIPYFKEKININTNIFGVVYPGKEYLIEGKGMPIMNTQRKGNMFIEFVIKYPKIKNKDKLNELSELLKETYQL
jgi:DnaJ-class molecular chaperone